MIVVFLCLSPSVHAADYGGKITTSSFNVKSNRLFDVEVGSSSAEILTAATFTLKYNSSEVEYRSVKCVVGNCSVRARDNSGCVKVIFLSSGGVSLDDDPLLFTVKFKKLGTADTEINISSADCVDENAERMKPMSSAVCKICGTGESITSESNRYGSHKGSGSGKTSRSKSSGSKSSEASATETSEPTLPDPESIDESHGKADNGFIVGMLIFLGIIIIVFVIIMYVRYTKPQKK